MTRRFNLIDVGVGLVVLILIPLGYSAFLLFRTARPLITSVEFAPSTNVEDRAAAGSALGGKLKVRGSGLRPVLRATIGEASAIAFIFETPSSADVLMGQMAPGTYDLILYDGVQEVARASKAVTIVSKVAGGTLAHVRVIGVLSDADEASARGLHVGERFPVTGDAAAEVVALGAPVPDLRAINEWRGRTEVATEGRWRRTVAVQTTCDFGSSSTTEECRVGGVEIGSAGTVLQVPGGPAWLRLRVEEIVPAAPPRQGEARVRFIGSPELLNLVKVGDVDDAALGLDGRGATIASLASQQVVPGDTSVTMTGDGGGDPVGIRATDRVAVFDAVLRLGLDPALQGVRYRTHVIKTGASLAFTTDRYTMRGTVISVTPGAAPAGSK